MLQLGTDGVRMRADAFDEGALEQIAGAVLATGGRHVLIGRDTRPSGERIAGVLADRLVRAGCTVGMTGVLTTPALSFLCAHTPGARGLMISASHNPVWDNGVKFFSEKGEKPGEEEEEALNGALALGVPLPQRSGGGIYDASQRTEAYVGALAAAFGPLLQGKRVMVDGAEGGGSRLAPRLLRALGACVRPFHCDARGEAINEGCGALHPEALLQALPAGWVGFALDGDGDRCVGVYEGQVYDGDDLLYAAALHRKRANRLPGDVVVGTLLTNSGLERAFSRQGIRLVRAAVGDKYVARKMAEEGAALGGEGSGHLIFGDLLSTGDGLISGVVFAASAPPERFARDPQFSLTLGADEGEKAKVRAAFPLQTYTGDARVVVRPSGTEARVRIFAESPVAAHARAAALQAAEQVKALLAGGRRDA